MTPTFLTIAILLLGTLNGIIAYFLKNLMERFAKTEVISNRNTTDIELIKQEADLRHNHLTEKFDELKGSIINLTGKIEELNKTIANK